jgi:hypothetical protein
MGPLNLIRILDFLHAFLCPLEKSAVYGFCYEFELFRGVKLLLKEVILLEGSNPSTQQSETNPF